MNFIPKIEYNDLLNGTPTIIQFDSPPEGDPFNESLRASTKATKSNNGTRQVQFNYLEESLTLEFIFQSETVKEAVKNWFNRHAVRGGKFNYFPSSDEAEYETYTFTGKAISFDRPIPTEVAGQFEYDFKIKIERVVNVL